MVEGQRIAVILGRGDRSESIWLVDATADGYVVRHAGNADVAVMVRVGTKSFESQCMAVMRSMVDGYHGDVVIPIGRFRAEVFCAMAQAAWDEVDADVLNWSISIYDVVVDPWGIGRLCPEEWREALVEWAPDDCGVWSEGDAADRWEMYYWAESEPGPDGPANHPADYDHPSVGEAWCLGRRVQ